MENPTLAYQGQMKHNVEQGDYSMICRSIADLRNKFMPTALLKKR